MKLPVSWPPAGDVARSKSHNHFQFEMYGNLIAGDALTAVMWLPFTSDSTGLYNIAMTTIHAGTPTD